MNNLTLINPATFAKISSIPFHSIEEAISIAKSSKIVQQEWKSSSIQERIDLINNVKKYFEQNIASIAEDITLQMGRPISHSINEVNGAIFRMDGLCEIAKSALKDIHLPEKEGFERYIKRESLGVVLDIVAWNYPLLIAVNIVISAVLAGNSVLIKHSSMTPMCAVHFEKAFENAGASAGLVRALVLTHETTEALINSEMIDYVSFTGSVSGGYKIQKTISNLFINMGLELGGKDPAYIREDAELPKTIENVMDGVFYNAGQSCCSVERIYVHSSLYEAFLIGAVNWMENLIINDPLNSKTTMGPLAQKSGISFIENQLEDALSKNAKLHIYSGDIPKTGNFMRPVIVSNANHYMDIMMEESFGPVVGIMSVNDDDEAIKLMNDSPYGLTASIWTQNQEVACEIADKINTGTIFMNRCDFLDPQLAWVGVKNSGKGASLSTIGIQQLTRPKSYHLKLTV
ncbi:MAG: aldehyde dehydrogenase family protein [Candidatus Marinimicrobia bacterium]|nr:aldehyde dehydrogenase family protein [Candidatus Neomarinimicrobiota bacterium]